MKARFKGPAGTGVVEFDNETTVRGLFDKISDKTGITDFSVKYGPPMAMKTLDQSLQVVLAKDLGLHGETLTIVPGAPKPGYAESGKGDPGESSQMTASDPSQSINTRNETRQDDFSIPWPQREGTLLLRVMPSDNSCLFTAFGGALPSQIPPNKLRSMMADYIMQHPSIYSEAVLGSPPSKYCQSIQDPDRWGGGIELSILSSIFDVQICTFDVQAESLIKFGENKRDRCILVYSGIHYDRVAFSYSDYPHDHASLPPEMDRGLWPVDDEEVLTKSQQLVRKLNSAHYYTDTEGLILRCDIPGCDWIGSGQAEGSEHAKQTGHFELSEIRDIEGDNVLRRCEAAGCGFIGQGDKAMTQHSVDTSHEGFSIIHDS